MRPGSTGWPQSAQSTLPVASAIGCSSRDSVFDFLLPVVLRPGFFLFGAFRPGVAIQPSRTFAILKTVFVYARYHYLPVIARNKNHRAIAGGECRADWV